VARPAGRNSDQTRARILAAAEHEFAARGYDGARMVAIARRAKLTHAMLHYHFVSKPTLYRAVLERVLGALAVHFENAVRLGAGGAPVGALGALIEAGQRVFADHPCFVRVMLWEIAGGGPRIDAIAGPFFDRMAKLVRASGGLVRPGHDPGDVAVSLVGAFLFYFFDDPLVLRLWGRRRFGPARLHQRAAHLRGMVDAFVLPGAASTVAGGAV
jgi:TetR/AcrR family transcriptional regulator